ESYTVQQTHVHPAWVQTCQDYLAQYPGGECEAMVLQPGHAPDVALVVVAALSPHIPAAAVDLNPVAVNDSLRVFGYGCAQPGGGGGKLLKTESLPALSVDVVDHTGEFMDIDDGAVYAAYVITPDHYASTAYASLCQGDSGGPLYRESTSE